jgi:hypothetical protein
MHARKLVEVATLAATHAPELIAGTLPPSGIEDYWVGSRLRLDRWSRSFRAFQRSLDSCTSAAATRAAWRDLRPVVEEVFVSEILTRFWGGVLAACDARRGVREAEPIGRAVLRGHLEARRRATYLADERSVGAGETAALKRLRQRADRWSDFLLGSLAHLHDVGGLAVDADRARDFATLLGDRTSARSRTAWQLGLVSLRSAFKAGPGARSPNGDVNARIASSVVSCLPPEQVASTEVFRSLWLVRLENSARDAQRMLDELLATEKV